MKKIFHWIFYYFLDIPKIVYFNLKNFPIRQALKFPVLLHKCELLGGGEFTIESEKVYTGMIRIGHRAVSHYPDSGCILENKGQIVFRGETRIGNQCAVSVYPKAQLTFGQDFCMTAGVNIVCTRKITFGNDNLIGWNTTIMDSSFHRMKDATTHKFVGKGWEQVEIGDSNWVSSDCKILAGTKTPGHCVVGANSLLSKDYTSYGQNIMLAGGPAKKVKEEIYWDKNDDKPETI